jgi:hypothetical protein
MSTKAHARHRISSTKPRMSQVMDCDAAQMLRRAQTLPIVDILGHD